MEYFILHFQNVLKFLLVISWVMTGICWLITLIVLGAEYDWDIDEYWKDRKNKVAIYGTMTVASILISCLYLFLYSI